MKSLIVFISDFFNNKGQYVFLSLLIAKICGFIGSLFIIRFLPENEFGTISIVASIFFIFASFGGFGSHQSLLRFGSIANTDSDRSLLSTYLLKKGLIYQILICFIFLLISGFYIDKSQDILLIFLSFTVRLIGFHLLNHILVEFRIYGDNRAFARVNNCVNLGGVFLLLLLGYFFGLGGYLIAIAVAPFFSLLWFRRIKIEKVFNFIPYAKNELWAFGLHAAFTAVLSDVLFSADILLLSYLMNEHDVAYYKVGLLIPFNITFLASTFMQSDYTILARNSKNKNFLKNYIANYYRLFIPISALAVVLGVVFNQEILLLFFSVKYLESHTVFIIFVVSFCLNMLLRNLYGNLLSAVGMMKRNTWISILTLILLILFAFTFVPQFGIEGMAISLSLSMVFGGILSLFSFYLYWKDLK